MINLSLGASVTVGICIKNASLICREKPVFSHLSLTIPAGKWVALLGPDGIGKSAFLRMIAGLSHTEEKAFYQLSSDSTEPIQQQTTLMSTKDQLRTWLTVFDNATLCLQLHQYSWEEQDQKRQQARLLLDELGMGDTLSFYPHQLTPAMRQRTALVRTLVENKPIVLLDEPYSELDYSERAQLKEMTARYLQGKTVIFITHEPTEALRFANEIIVMQGHPATLKSIATFSSATPRELSDPQLTAIHAILHGRLAEVE